MNDPGINDPNSCPRRFSHYVHTSFCFSFEATIISVPEVAAVGQFQSASLFTVYFCHRPNGLVCVELTYAGDIDQNAIQSISSHVQGRCRSLRKTGWVASRCLDDRGKQSKGI